MRPRSPAVRAPRRLARAAALVLSAVALPATALPLAAQAPAHAGRTAEARAGAAVLDSVLHEAGVPGLSAAVWADGRVAWAGGAGLADLEQRVPVTPLTRFRVGSVSKPITAAGMALLVEEGRLDLDAPLQRYVPAFPEKRWPITTRQLAGHLAGVRHYRDEEFLSARRYATVAEGLEIFARDTLLFEPGTRYAYSSYGWNLLSAVVEGASGEPFLAFMRRRVLEPLGLRHTVADHVDSLVAGRARPYARSSGDEALLNAPHVDNSYKWAGGGFLSTPTDLVRFAAAHFAGGFLRAATVDELWTSQRTRDGEATGYGLGWRVDEDDPGRRIVFHGGGSVGGRTMLLAYPEDGVAVAAVTNLTGGPVDRALAERLAAIFLERPGEDEAEESR